MPGTTLETVGLSKSFAGPPLFSGLSFSIERGLIAVTGRNGAGKTTLLKILAGLLRPSAGKVRLRRNGEELSGSERRLSVGWAGADLAFYEELSAEENLRFFRRAAGWDSSPEDLRNRLEAVGLDKAAALKVGEFSTGMKQRLRIAFALLFDPPILLLDEPLAGLDAEGQKMVSRFIAASRERGAVVVASHEARDFPSPERVIELGKS